MSKYTDLSLYDNTNYNPGNLFFRFFWIIISFILFQHSLSIGSSWKVFILKLFGSKIGKGVVIKPNVIIKYPWFLSVGNYTWLGEHVWIDNLCMVSIGSNCCISQGALLLTGNHDYTKNTFDLITGEIKLADGVFIGAKSIVCPGVTANSHSILTSGSVATKKLESYSIYQGNPALLIRNRTIL